MSAASMVSICRQSTSGNLITIKGIKMEKPKENPRLDLLCGSSNWSAAVDDEHCERMAQQSGKTLKEVHPTSDKTLKVICEWEEEG